MNDVRANQAVFVEPSGRNFLQQNPGHRWRASDPGGTIVRSLVTCRDLFSSNERVNDPFETFLALDHFDNQLSLDDLVIFENVRLKLLVAAADLSDNIVRLLLQMDLVDSDQIQ